MRKTALAVLALGLACGGPPNRQTVKQSNGQTVNPSNDQSVLRVCADPNNLPFSNSHEQGFENALARIIAADLGRTVKYTWWAQRRGFVRNTLRANLCDVVVGIAASSELVLATRPYYRSTYVFVTRTDRHLDIESFDDPRLRRLRIGVHFIGDDGANAPPAHALTRRGIVRNVHGYSIYGDYTRPNPPMELVSALVRGDIDVAIVWGPFAGWAKKEGAPIRITPVSPQVDVPFLPYVYDIALGVRRGDDSLKTRLEEILERRRPEIRSLLARFGIPVVETRRRVVVSGAVTQ